MARLPLLDRLRRRRAGTSGERRIAPTPGALRRERRALLRAREERIRDLGGLMLEMFRRDHYREELVFEQCAELVALEDRILELDALAAAAASGRRGPLSGRCACGAPLVWGSHFCANCGRPAGEPVVGCPTCGHPLPADANFCANCGTSADLIDRESAPSEAYDVAEEPGREKDSVEIREEESAPALDPWER